MSDVVAFAYVQARVQACLGRRPGPDTWRHLKAIGEFTPFLERARTTELRPWVAHLSSATPAQEIERSLRQQLRGVIETVASWMPSPWQPSVRWTGVLMDLPAIYALVKGDPMQEWMRSEATLEPYLDRDPAVRKEVLRSGPLGPYLTNWESGPALRDAWLAAWRALWPERGTRGAASLEELVGIFVMHLARFSELLPSDTWEARQALGGRLGRLFRRALLEPAAAFAYLALVALDVERLRGELVSRRLFARQEISG